MSQQQDRALFAGKAWYAVFFGCWAFVNPYLNVYFRSLGYNAGQIGILSAMRPWVSAPSGATWCSLADHFQCHRHLLAFAQVASVLAITSLAVKAQPFVWLLGAMVLTELFRSPIPILADTVVSAATTDSSQYGKCRLWGAVTWGSVGMFSGTLVDGHGMLPSFGINFVCGLAAVGIILFGLDFSYLSAARSKTSAAGGSAQQKSLQQRDVELSEKQQQKGGFHLQLDTERFKGSYVISSKPVLTQKNGSDSRDISPLSQALEHPQRAWNPALKLPNEFEHDVGDKSSLLAGDASRMNTAHTDQNTARRRSIGGVSSDSYASHQPLPVSSLAFPQPMSERRGMSTDISSNWQHGEATGGQDVDDGGDFDGTAHEIRGRRDSALHGNRAHRRAALPLEDEYDEEALVPMLDKSVTAQSGAKQTGLQDKLRVLGSPAVVLFLAKAILMGFGMGVVSSFMFLYVEHLHGSKRLMGLGNTFTCIAEVPILHFSGSIIDRIGSLQALNVVLAAFVIRLGAYSTMSLWPTLWLLLPVELLHGITFGLAWATGTLYAKEIAPAGLNATVQSAFQTCYFGVGTGLGGLVGGMLYEHVGEAECFFWAATTVLIGALICNGVGTMLGVGRSAAATTNSHTI